VKKEEWRKQGACRGADPDLFFSDVAEERQEAKAICSGCPVLAECLQAAMAEEEGKNPGQNLKLRSGIRGGMTAMERWELAHPGLAEPYRAKRNARLRAARSRAREETSAMAGAAALGLANYSFSCYPLSAGETTARELN
jgi:WhiB family redox-sensing transcriptional regulator